MLEIDPTPVHQPPLEIEWNMVLTWTTHTHKAKHLEFPSIGLLFISTHQRAEKAASRRDEKRNT